MNAFAISFCLPSDSVPLEKPEIKARQSKVEDKIKEEFQIDFIDRQENPDPNVMKKLKRMENSVK